MCLGKHPLSCVKVMQNRRNICIKHFYLITLFFKNGFCKMSHGNAFGPINIGKTNFFSLLELLHDAKLIRLTSTNAKLLNFFIIIFLCGSYFFFCAIPCVIRSSMMANITTPIPPSNPNPIFIWVIPFNTTSPKPPAEIIAAITTIDKDIMMV